MPNLRGLKVMLPELVQERALGFHDQPTLVMDCDQRTTRLVAALPSSAWYSSGEEG
jgi:hypothetical protein